MNMKLLINKLSLQTTKREKGRKQVNIAQTKEMINVIAERIAENPLIAIALYEHGKALKAKKGSAG